MLNIFSLICIYLNYIPYLSSSSLFFAKLPKAYPFFNPLINIMPIITLFVFLLAIVWQVAVSFQ